MYIYVYTEHSFLQRSFLLRGLLLISTACNAAHNPAHNPPYLRSVAVAPHAVEFWVDLWVFVLIIGDNERT